MICVTYELNSDEKARQLAEDERLARELAAQMDAEVAQPQLSVSDMMRAQVASLRCAKRC